MATRSLCLQLLIFFCNLNEIKCQAVVSITNNTSWTNATSDAELVQGQENPWNHRGDLETSDFITCKDSSTNSSLMEVPSLLSSLTSSHQGKTLAHSDAPFSMVRSVQTPMLSAENRTNILINLFQEILLPSEVDEASLERLLMTIITQNLKECDLIILFDRSFRKSHVLLTLFQLQEPKQVLMLPSTAEEDVDQLLWESSRCKGIFVLITDPEPFIQFGNNRLLEWAYRARVIIAGLTHESLTTFMGTMKAKKTEHILGIVKSGRSGTFKIFMNDLFWGNRGIVQVDTWKGNSFTMSPNYFPDKISNLRQAVLELLIFEFEPAIVYRRDAKGQLLERYGRDVEVFNALKTSFNFSVAPKEPDPKELFGNWLPNGSYSGMVGMLGRGIGDIAIANHWIIHERLQFLDYSTPFDDDQGCCLARIEPPLPLWQSPSLPFQLDTWIAILIGLILAGPILYALASGSVKRNKASLLQSSLHAYEVHFSQPAATLPTLSSTRIFIAFLWLYSIILSTGYKSNLTAFLTVTREPKSIETFLELYKSGLTLIGHPFFKQQFEITDIDYIRSMIPRYDVRMRFDETTEDVLAGKAVTISSKMYLTFFLAQSSTSNGKPNYRIMKECSGQYSVALAYQRHSPLKTKFDQRILWMFEGGLVRRWFLESIDTYRQLQNSTNQDLETSDERNQDGVIALRLEHLQGVFVLWIFGAIASGAAFSVEVYFGP